MLPWRKSRRLADFSLPPAGEISVRALRRAALNSDGRAILHGFLLANVTRRARPPSLMLRPDGLAPARLHRLANVPPGVPFASPARESRRALLDCHRANPPGHDIQRLRRAGDGGGNFSSENCGCRPRLPRERAAFAPLPRRWLAPVRNCPHAQGEIAKMLDTLPPSSARYARRHGVQTSGFALARLCRGKLCRVNSTWLCGRLA